MKGRVFVPLSTSEQAGRSRGLDPKSAAVPGVAVATTSQLAADAPAEIADAVAHPRIHLKIDEAGDGLAIEPGVDLPATDIDVVLLDTLNMYFGGVGAVVHDTKSEFDVAVDPRREGDTFIVRAN